MRQQENIKIIRKVIGIIITMVCLFVILTANADGILPGLSDTVGIGMPSLGEALLRYPDSEIENEDGSITELFANVSEADFNSFSIYLESQGAMLADYKVVNGLLIAEIQAKGASFQLSYNSRSGEVKVIYPSGTFDERTKIAKTHFETAQKLLEEGKAEDALTELLAIPQYNEYDPAANLLNSNDNLVAAAAAAAREAKLVPYRTIGNKVAFGLYEQDNNTENGMEAIEWIVLDYEEKEHKALLLSQYGLEVKQYNIEKTDITWERCSLRHWLNSEFLKSAFSANEQAAILMTTVDNSDSQGYSKWNTDGGNNTQDHIFLLSYAEANRYLDVTEDNYNNTKARVAPTAYAITQDVWAYEEFQTSNGEPAAWWWLRSPSTDQECAAIVHANGALLDNYVTFVYGVVRPAFWLNLESDIF